MNSDNENLISEFMKDSSPRTLSSYMYEFRRFDEFLQEKYGKEVLFFNVTEMDARDFKKYLECLTYRTKNKNETYNHYKESTITKILRIFHSFYAYYSEEGLIEENPFNGVEIPITTVTGIKEERILTEYENQKLLECAKASGNRDYALVLLMETSHFIVQELLNFCWGDIRYDGIGTWLAEVVTKGGTTTRVIPLRDDAFYALMAYRKELGKPDGIDYTNEADSRVFLNYKNEPIKEIGIRKIIKTLCKKAKIVPEITPKDLANLNKVLNVLSGANDKQILEQTGLSSISYLKARTRYAKRKYLREPACKKIILPIHGSSVKEDTGNEN